VAKESLSGIKPILENATDKAAFGYNNVTTQH
jgi:hypothetical protein